MPPWHRAERYVVSRSTRATWQAASFLSALALNILIFVPFSPYFPEEELDASWRYATNYGLSHHLQFGRDLIFTSGPLSFLYIRQYYPGNYAVMLALSVLVIAALTIGCWTVARKSRRTLILTLPLLLSQAPDYDAVFLFVPLVLLWVACQAAERRAKTVVLALLTVVCALLPLVKGSFAIAVLALCAITFAADVRSRPLRAASLAALFVSILCIAWLACGQAPATLADYAASEAQIVSGYTDAMSTSGPNREPLLFAGAAAAILVLGLVGLFRRTAFCVLGLAVTLFLCFKAGFVRQDGHVLIATSALLLAGFLVTLAGRGKVASLALPVGIAAWCLISWPYLSVDTLSDVGRFTEAVGRSVSAIGTLATDRGGMRKSFEAALTAIRSRHPLDGIAGSIDLYPTDVAVVLANGLEWKPRPVIQSYSAYTEQLATLNAESLERPGAPDTILFQVATIDGRYPALDDGRSWPALTARYRPVGIRGDYVELRKRDAAAMTSIGGPVVDREVEFGEQIAVPPGPVWAEIDVEPTVPGRLVAAAYKLPPLTLAVDYADGSAREFRLIASIAKAGFLLSPTIEKATALLALQSTVPAPAGPEETPVNFSIGIENGAGGLWRGRFRVVLRPIMFPKTAGIAALLFVPLKPMKGDLPSAFGGDCAIDEVARRDGDQVPLDAGTGTLNLRGWAMMSGTEGLANSHLSVALLPEGGGSGFLADLPKLASPGLAEHFGTPAAGEAAFDADIDIASLPRGRYRLQLVEDGQDGEAVQCGHRTVVVERR